MDPGEESLVGETLEDISLLSTLSLDRNYICHEYMEDFDKLGEKTELEYLYCSFNFN